MSENLFVAAADRATDPSPAWGDERDRLTLLRAHSYGLRIATGAAVLVAVLLAFVGEIVFSVLTLLLVYVLPWLAAKGYAKAKGTDAYALWFRAPRREIVLRFTGTASAVALILIAAYRLASAGVPPLPTLALAPSVLDGFVLGGVVGLAVGLVGLVIVTRRAQAQRLASDAADDE